MKEKLLSTFKPAIVSTLRGIGGFELWRARQRQDLIILMYHRFSVGPEPFKICRADFEKQIAFFTRKYSILSFPDLLGFFKGKNDLPPNPLLLTIDDGYQDNFEVAYPVLRRFGASATIFLTTDFVSRKAWLWANKLEYILKNSARPGFDFTIEDHGFSCRVDSFGGWHRSQLALFNKLRVMGDQKDEVLSELAEYLEVDVPPEVTSEFRSLDWHEILEMQDNGIHFGSHTCSHPILSAIPQDRLERELRDSKAEIEGKIGTAVEVICYPNGQPEDFSPATIEAARKCGYQAGVTTVSAKNDPGTVDPFLLNRSSMTTSKVPEMAVTLLRLPRGE